MLFMYPLYRMYYIGLKGVYLLSYLCHFYITCYYLLGLDHNLNHRISYSSLDFGWIGVILIRSIVRIRRNLMHPLISLIWFHLRQIALLDMLLHLY